MTRQSRAHLLEIGLASLLINLISLAAPLFSLLVYDKVIGNNINATLFTLALGMTMAIGADAVLRSRRGLLIERRACREDVAADVSVLTAVVSDRAGSLRSPGEVLARYKEFSAAKDMMASAMLIALIDLPFTLLFLLMMAVIGGPVVLAPVIIGALLMGVAAALRGPTNQRVRRTQGLEAARLNLLAEMLSHADLLRASPLRAAFDARWRRMADAASKARGEMRLIGQINAIAMSEGALLMWVSVIVIGALLTGANLLSVGGLTACSILANRVGAQIASFIMLVTRRDLYRRARAEFQAALPGGADAAGAPDGEGPTLSPRPMRGEVLARETRFSYPGVRRPSLDGVTLHVAPGEQVGLVGRNGSGKSTLLRCLAGALTPQEGQILMDGAALQAYAPADRADFLAFKPQDPLLFEGSLEDNLLLGAPLTPERGARLRTALATTGLDALLERGELSLDMMVRGHGANLSGGQRQAVALARALMIDAAVFILDEPTSGMDQALEAALIPSLLAEAKGKTLIVASHSVPLLRALPRLVVMEGGKILADGPTADILTG